MNMKMTKKQNTLSPLIRAKCYLNIPKCFSYFRPSALSVLVLVGDLEHKFSRDAAQIYLIDSINFDFLTQKDPMTAHVVVSVHSPRVWHLV